MSANSKIEWCEATWNCLAGCSEISPGCAHCYAATMAARLEAMGQEKYRGTTKKAGTRAHWTGQINLDEKALQIPLKTKKPTTYFVNSMSDLFHEAVPSDFIDSVFRVMVEAKQHTFQVLTKRAERMAEYTCKRWGRFDGKEYPLSPNIWLGVSCEDQQRFDERQGFLRATPAAVRFLSCEPLLGPINLHAGLCKHATGKPEHAAQTYGHYCNPSGEIHWVIVGGESGQHARVMQLEWAQSIVDQCKAAGVPVFVKQMGSNPKATGYIEGLEEPDLYPIHYKSKKGGDPSEWIKSLQVREYPERSNG